MLSPKTRTYAPHIVRAALGGVWHIPRQDGGALCGGELPTAQEVRFLPCLLDPADEVCGVCSARVRGGDHPPVIAVEWFEEQTLVTRVK